MNPVKKINLHTHTTFCDGKNTAEEMVLSAIEKGFDILGFSGHCIYPLDPAFYLPEESWHIKPQDIEKYLQEINRLKEKYADKILILCGFEADYLALSSTGTACPSKKAYASLSPDYLIGSVHFVENQKGFYSVDHTPENVRENLLKLYGEPCSTEISPEAGKKAVCEYFQAQREMLAHGDFDIWGHPDLIRKRNGAINFFDEKESWYKEQLELTAKAAARTGVIAEINTGAIFRKAMDDLYPSAYFLELLHKNHIPVCVSSDSHSIDSIDFAFDRAYAAARRAGYTELNYPVQGKIITIKL